jgi:hypothetical protein
VRRYTSIAALVALLALLIMGLWVGAFETFGGYIWRQNVFAVMSLIVGIGMAALLRFHSHVRWLVVLACFALSHGVYVFGTALGQVWYVGPTSAGDFLHLLASALNNEL